MSVLGTCGAVKPGSRPPVICHESTHAENVMHSWEVEYKEHLGPRPMMDDGEQGRGRGIPTGEQSLKEKVNHPAHYGGKDNPHETIKCIEAWGLNYALGNAVKYISRAGKKGSSAEDLLKAIWYVMHDVRHNHNYPGGDFKDRLHDMVDKI